MNSPSLPALAAAYLADTCSDGAPFAPSSGSPTPQAYCAPDKMTAFFRPSRFGMTFAPLTDDRGAALLTWYRAGFPARTSAPPAKAQASTASDPACGAKWRELSVKYDRDSSSWKTHRCLWDEDLPESSLTLPKWGSMRDGVLSERMTSALPTAETDAGLWATPSATDGTRGGTITENMTGVSLVQMVNTPRHWPTPTKADGCGGPGHSGRAGGLNLRTAVKTWPTPTVNDSKNCTLPPSQIHHDNIPGALLRDGEQAGGQLNPAWVEWLMNWPINWTSLEPIRDDYFSDWKEKSATGLPDNGEGCLRALWWDKEPSATPYRPQPDEQCPEQYRVSMRGLPCSGAQENETCDMRDLRNRIPAKAQQEGDVMRITAMPEREGQTISRTAMGVIARVDRLKAIGNGQVPQCAAAAWRILIEGVSE